MILASLIHAVFAFPLVFCSFSSGNGTSSIPNSSNKSATNEKTLNASYPALLLNPDTLARNLNLPGFRNLRSQPLLKLFDHRTFDDSFEGKCEALEFVHHQIIHNLEPTIELFNDVMAIIFQEASALVKSCAWKFRPHGQKFGKRDAKFWDMAFVHFINSNDFEGFMVLRWACENTNPCAEAFLKSETAFERAVPQFIDYFDGRHRYDEFWNLFNYSCINLAFLIIVCGNLPIEYFEVWFFEGRQAMHNFAWFVEVVASLVCTRQVLITEDSHFAENIAKLFAFGKKYYSSEMTSRILFIEYLIHPWKSLMHLRRINALNLLYHYRFNYSDQLPRFKDLISIQFDKAFLWTRMVVVLLKQSRLDEAVDCLPEGGIDIFYANDLSLFFQSVVHDSNFWTAVAKQRPKWLKQFLFRYTYIKGSIIMSNRDVFYVYHNVKTFAQYCDKILAFRKPVEIPSFATETDVFELFSLLDNQQRADYFAYLFCIFICLNEAAPGRFNELLQYYLKFCRENNLWSNGDKFIASVNIRSNIFVHWLNDQNIVLIRELKRHPFNVKVTFLFEHIASACVQRLKSFPNPEFRQLLAEDAKNSFLRNNPENIDLISKEFGIDVNEHTAK